MAINKALRQADRAQLAETLAQQIKQRVEQRLAAEVDRRVATDVAHKVQEILEQQTLLRHRMFGRSSEAHAGQGQLFNEAERDAFSTEGEGATEFINTPEASPGPKQQPTRRRGKRKPLPPELPRVEHVVEPPVAENPCDCGTPMVKIGDEVSEQLDIIPMKVRVIRTVRPRYGCAQGKHAPRVAPTVPAVLPRSKLGQALNYLNSVWPKLIRYTERGDLPIDNNACENAIRPFVVGARHGCSRIHPVALTPVP